MDYTVWYKLKVSLLEYFTFQTVIIMSFMLNSPWSEKKRMKR